MRSSRRLVGQTGEQPSPETARGAAVPQQEGNELEALARLAELLPQGPEGEVWFGDDAAVVQVVAPGARAGEGLAGELVAGPAGAGRSGRLLMAADSVVGGVDADLSVTSLADFGWKALAVNLSDIAAMGGAPAHALVSVVGLDAAQLQELYGGLLEASREYGCPVVGGDLSAGPAVVVSVAVTGWAIGEPVLRTGARAGDAIWATGPLGAAAAGLRLLQSSRDRGGGLSRRWGAEERALVGAHARPKPALAEGSVARRAGATAMIDVSDGLVADLGHLAQSSGVGYELATVPVAPGATLAEALGGGDDYVLVFAAPPGSDIAGAFEAAGLRPPARLGTCVADRSVRLLGGAPLAAAGWEHQL